MSLKVGQYESFGSLKQDKRDLQSGRRFRFNPIKNCHHIKVMKIKKYFLHKIKKLYSYSQPYMLCMT